MVSCPTCTNNLEWYLLQVHGDADGETHYSCDKCDYVNKSHPKYKEHINAIHTKEVVYLCDQCNFTTYRKSNLRPHLKNVHEKYKPNKCDKCFAAFLTKRELNKHFENKHPGLKWIWLLKCYSLEHQKCLRVQEEPNNGNKWNQIWHFWWFRLYNI